MKTCSMLPAPCCQYFLSWSGHDMLVGSHRGLRCCFWGCSRVAFIACCAPALSGVLNLFEAVDMDG